MRIIAGEAKGRRLFAPEGTDTRPTTDRVRESLFGILTPRLAEANVLDLFAGTGALSLEAVSRGASGAVLCDKADKAVKVILRNVESAGFSDRIGVLRCDWTQAVRRLKGRKFDIVFLDPPYRELHLYGEAAALLKQEGLLNEDAVIVMEHLTRDEPPLPEGFRVYDRRRYGDTSVDLVREED